ncbi:unnamed protein product [Lathyrus oleraceus]
MTFLMSKEHRGFIKGRNIKDCICLASEVVNVLDNKHKHGNLVLKVDIMKAFDTISWDFLLSVLNKFGFCRKFCDWMHTLLWSAYLSINFNDQQHGYFKCKRGVRQGDPLSPLLFCLAEDVLSRGISRIVSQGGLELIMPSRNNWVPSHIFYVDDTMIYYTGKPSNIQALKHIFQDYSVVSDRSFNLSKSFTYSGFISMSQLDWVIANTSFSKGSLPFNYLGILIFKWRPKAIHLSLISDKILARLSAFRQIFIPILTV